MNRMMNPLGIPSSSPNPYSIPLDFFDHSCTRYPFKRSAWEEARYHFFVTRRYALRPFRGTPYPPASGPPKGGTPPPLQSGGPTYRGEEALKVGVERALRASTRYALSTSESVTYHLLSASAPSWLVPILSLVSGGLSLLPVSHLTIRYSTQDIG